MGAALALSLLSVGCFGNKNKDVEVAAPAPPPAAYPDTSAAMGAATGGTAPVPSVPSNATMAATNSTSAAPAPAPFSLREGEQLVPHQIQSGENLSTIATRYNTTIGRIQSANGMTDTRIYAGKTIQVPTSAPPTGRAQTAPAAPSAGLYGSTAPAPAPTAPTYSSAMAGSYPGTTSAPAPAYPSATAPSSPAYPSISSSSGAISAPPVPSASAPAAVPPGYPASTSYPRTAPAPTAPAYPTPSFQGSRVQFSN
jgi:LysM repeat protein